MPGLSTKNSPMTMPATLKGSMGLLRQVARWKASALTMPMQPASRISQPIRLQSAAVAFQGRKTRNRPSTMPPTGSTSLSQRMFFMTMPP